MSLIIGHGPFGPESTGRLNVETPDRVVYIEPFPRRALLSAEGVGGRGSVAG